MTPRTFLVNGLLAGLVAAIAAFVVAYTVGEPQIDTAIGLEEAASATAGDGHSHDHAEGDEAAHTHSHGDEGTSVSREHQATFGLATAILALSLAYGGVLGLIAAFATGRLGRLTAAGSTAVVSLVAFVAYALVPFLKYPATPPAVGSGDTIGERTALYFGFVLVSVVVAAAAVVLAVKLLPRLGGYGAIVSGAAAYIAVMLVAGGLFSTVNEVGDFPADVLWFFRRDSLLTVATTWGVLGVVLTGLVLRSQNQAAAAASKREAALAL
ncbi:CbtA family protein [Mumia zhuanghuii]|uniref:CbtA family protein n=2 Tax=Mumia TaxID=1546255 RepID=A0ABW1QSQ9_9ACTN|nr:MULTISPECIES: CbtA family protein [Mumia]KAA1424451.1 CbtA family protein [Mumia zhuanghuii]